MVTAIFAVGANKEFGNKGKLPWGSFYLELESFYSAIEESFCVPNSTMPILLVGNNTWRDLPLPAVNKLLEYTKLVYVLAKKDAYIPKRADETLAVLTNIGSKLPPEFDYANVVCIGGSFLLTKLFENYHVDKAFVSTITQTKDGEPEIFEADTFLQLPQYVMDSTSTLVRRGSVTTSDNKMISFTQELYYI